MSLSWLDFNFFKLDSIIIVSKEDKGLMAGTSDTVLFVFILFNDRHYCT